MPVRPGLAARSGRRLAPAGLVVVQSPAGATSGQPFGTPLIVRLTDLFGHIVTKSGLALTVTIVSGTGSLTGASATTDAQGIASFPSLAITGSGSFTLRVGGSLISSVTVPVDVVAVASQFQILVMPTTGIDNLAFTTQPQLRVLDGFGNPVLQAGIVVTAQVFTGNGTVIGSITATTDASGIATFATLGIDDADLT